MKMLEREGARVAYDELGAGEATLLCLPGWCITRSLFSPLAAHLEPRARVLTMDWRGHGDSKVEGDFGEDDMVADALAVIEASRARTVVILAQAHAGWVAIELVRRLQERAAALVLTSWALGELPPPLERALPALQDPARWQATREQLTSQWKYGASPELARSIQSVISPQGFDMWARAAKSIASAYARERSPFDALSRGPRVPTLHLYSQPRAPEYLAAQEHFAREHPWFTVERLDGSTHFPMLEDPRTYAERVAGFLVLD